MLYEDNTDERDVQDDGDFGLGEKAIDSFKDNFNNQNQALEQGSQKAASQAAGAGSKVGTSESAGAIASEATKDAVAAGASKTAGASTVGAGAEAGAGAGAGGATATAGAGAATGGVAIIVAAVLMVASKIKNETKSVTEKGTVESDYKAAFILFLVVNAVMLFFMIINNLKITPGSTENYKQSSFAKKPGIEVAHNTDEFTSGDYEKVEEYNYKNPLENAAKEYIKNEEYGFEKSLDIAISDKCHDIVKSLGSRKLMRIINHYDVDKSLEWFYGHNKWPYDIQIGRHPITDEFYYPCIGDILKQESKVLVHPEKYAEYKPNYNDVNYAEVLSIFGDNPELNWRYCNLEEFHDIISSNKAKNLYFELKVEWIVVYKGKYTDESGKQAEETQEVPYDTEEDACNSPTSIQMSHCVGNRDSYWCRTTVKPFGLRELYMMSDVDPYAEHNDYRNFTNYEMLNRHEMYERTYIRKAEPILGPSYNKKRNAQSPIYDDLVNLLENHIPKGRSAWYYIENPYNLENYDTSSFNIPEGFEHIDLSEIGIDTSRLTSDQETLLKFLVVAVGCEYDQENRYGEKSYDCSSLVVRAYRSIGINIAGTGTMGIKGGWNGGTNTASIYEWGHENGKLSNTLKVGSIVVYNRGGDYDYHDGISHVGIYIGDGQMIDARGVKYGVVKRQMPQDSIYAIINPL